MVKEWGKAALAAALSTVYLTGEAAAQPEEATVYTSINGTEMAGLMRQWGYRADLYTTSDGFPEIESGAQGVNFWVLFFECGEEEGEKQRCFDIQFHSVFSDVPNATAERINEWNSTWRFYTAYIEEDAIRITTDMTLYGGVTAENIEEHLLLFDTGLGDFLEFIDW